MKISGESGLECLSKVLRRLRLGPDNEGLRLPNEIENELIVEEYKSCRDLITRNIDIMEKAELFAIGAVAAVAAFSLSSKVKSVEIGSSYIPMFIVAIGYKKYTALDLQIRIINDYLISIESKTKNLRWTHSYRENNNKSGNKLRKNRNQFWVTLGVASLVFSLFVHIFVLLVGPFDTEASGSKPAGIATKTR